MALFARSGVGKLRHVVSVQCIPFPSHNKEFREVIDKHSPKLDVLKSVRTTRSLAKLLPHHISPHITCGINVQHQYRYVHTDVTKVPSFDNYRLDSTKDPARKISEKQDERYVYNYAVLFAGAVMATYVAKNSVQKILGTLAPNAKVLADSTLEVDLSTIPEGKNVVLKWRNKPLFVRHRTTDEVDTVRSVPVTELRDPEEDHIRVKKDEWLVVIGICTHLGCVPISNAGDFGGYYCPCHGSHYDASGRIRKGPAPLNLEVPSYQFLDESTILVG
jgi:ubiquinol-cytochrome c reductase iron-sulfur subunit